MSLKVISGPDGQGFLVECKGRNTAKPERGGLECDWSGVDVGAILCQRDTGGMHLRPDEP